VEKEIYQNEPIAAVSTPPGRGGIAVIRASGEGVIALVSKLCSRDLGTVRSNSIVHVRINDVEGRPLDDGMAAVFRAPRSFTGEDTVELSCHGGTFVVSAVLGELYRLGIRPAEAGEFTRRAFLSGKLGLSAAEGIADIIDADSREQLMLAVTQADGGLGREFSRLYDAVSALVSEMYVRIDYPDVDLPEDFVPNLNGLAADLGKLEAGYKTGRAVRDGVVSVICGAPNAGKSSLMNLLLGEERAIVTDIAGTTRDTIEERLTLGGITLRLCDTAGLRETSDTVEKIGVERALSRLGDAGLRIAVFDTSRMPDADDESLLSALESSKDVPTAAVLNKCDIGTYSAEYLGILEKRLPDARIIRMSAKTGMGRDELEAAVSEMFGADDVAGGLIISNARQYAAVKRAADALNEAKYALESGQPDDIVGMLLEGVMSAIGECDGRAVSQDIVDNIFSRFCVGK